MPPQGTTPRDGPAQSTVWHGNRRPPPTAAAVPAGAAPGNTCVQRRRHPLRGRPLRRTRAPFVVLHRGPGQGGPGGPHHPTQRDPDAAPERELDRLPGRPVHTAQRRDRRRAPHPVLLHDQRRHVPRRTDRAVDHGAPRGPGQPAHPRGGAREARPSPSPRRRARSPSRRPNRSISSSSAEAAASRR